MKCFGIEAGVVVDQQNPIKALLEGRNNPLIVSERDPPIAGIANDFRRARFGVGGQNVYGGVL
nr:hypothetical protein [Nocardioides solisilvae]